VKFGAEVRSAGLRKKDRAGCRRYANLSLRETGLERARMGRLVRADVSG